MSITTSSHAVVGTPLRRCDVVATTASSGRLRRFRDAARHQGTQHSRHLCPADPDLDWDPALHDVLARPHSLREEHSIIQQIFQKRREAQLVLVAFIATVILIITLQTAGGWTSDGFGWRWC